MKLTTTILTAATATTLVLVSCKNPAETSTAAEVSEAKELSTVQGQGQKWVIGEGSSITFVGSKVTGSHEGGFEKFDGHFYVQDGQLSEAGHQVVIDLNSTFSDNAKLTAHLKNTDFFDVATYPTSTFTVTGLKEQSGPKDATHELTGNFDLHGVTKSLAIPIKVDQSDDKIQVTADFFIKRSDFGIEYPGKQDDLIRDEVVIRFDLHATPAE